MKLDKKKHFARLPVYVVIVYFLASVPITIYLARNTASFKQYQYAQENPASTVPFGRIRDCFANGNCPTSSPVLSQKLIPENSSPVLESINPNQTSPEASLGPTTDPCVLAAVSAQHYNSQSHRRPHRQGFFDRILDFIIYIINIILKILGVGYIFSPGGVGVTVILAPAVETPTPTPTPIPVGVTPVLTINPCVTSMPTITVYPTEIPVISSEPTEMPTIPDEPTEMSGVSDAPNSGTSENVKITFYTGYETGGFPDGYYVAEPVLHQKTGGVGSYIDPLTFAALATDRGGQYPKGTIIYVPLLQKYFIREDKCEGCSASQVDLYIGNPSNSKVAADCASALTPIGDGIAEIIINPSDGLPVDDNIKIWDQSTGTCMSPHN